MKRFIGSHDETIECKIAVSEKKRDGELRSERTRGDEVIRRYEAKSAVSDSIPFAIINSPETDTCRLPI